MREVVALCLQKEPEKRPPARALLEHRFFKQAKDKAWIQKHLLTGLPPLAERVRQLRCGRGPTAASPQADSKKEIRSMARYIAGVAGAAACCCLYVSRVCAPCAQRQRLWCRTCRQPACQTETRTDGV